MSPVVCETCGGQFFAISASLERRRWPHMLHLSSYRNDAVCEQCLTAVDLGRKGVQP